MAGDDLLFAFSHITNHSLTDETYNEWYDAVHIPDLLKTSGITRAYRYRNTTSDPPPYLAIYPTTIAFLQTPEVMSIPMSSDMLPASHYLFDIVSYDTRHYKHIQTFEPPNIKPGPAPLLIVAAITPMHAGDDSDKDMDKWYRTEHLHDLAKVKGYRRTRRYELVWHGRVPDKGEKQEAPPRFLAMHEFEEGFDMGDVMKTAATDWGKEIMKDRTEISVMKLVAAHGKGVDAKL